MAETAGRLDGPQFASVPMQVVGPLSITGPILQGDVRVPLATYESPLFPSVERGARVTARSGGISVSIDDDRMSRSVLFEAPTAHDAIVIAREINAHVPELSRVISSTSRFAKLLELKHEVVGRLLYLRVEISTGDAAGHNMVTLAAEQVMDHILAHFTQLRYVSISGNYCTDKKVSAVNGILGRGKSVVAEAQISAKLCRRFLKSSPERIAELNVKKNLIGSIVAGGIRSANAHYANMLLAFYLATGQDAANIVEGSQGITQADIVDGDLYFTCSLPNVIVGTVGNGKDLPFVEENLTMLGCREDREPGENARRLAAIAGAVVLCGELSLMAAQTNPGELMDAHQRLERKS